MDLHRLRVTSQNLATRLANSSSTDPSETSDELAARISMAVAAVEIAATLNEIRSVLGEIRDCNLQARWRPQIDGLSATDQ